MATHNLQEAPRSIDVSGQVLYLATLLLFTGIVIIGLAIAFPVWERAVLHGLAGLSFLGALFIIVWSVIVRPDLLRSEEYALLDGIVTGISDEKMDLEARERLLTQLLETLTPGSGEMIALGRDFPQKE